MSGGGAQPCSDLVCYAHHPPSSPSPPSQFPSGYWEQNLPFYDKLEVASAAGMPITAGSTYHWDVPVLIPCNAAPYERGRCGRNYWRAAVKMQLPGLILKRHVTSEKVSWCGERGGKGVMVSAYIDL